MKPREPLNCLPSCLPVLAMALLVTVSGCYNSNEVKAFLQKPHNPVSGLEYRILPPDVITITSIQVPEINGFQSQVRPDGKINLPLLGELYVAEKTSKEVEEAVKQAAKKYYDEVDASVQIAGYNSRKFYVFGEVSRPGAIRWTGCDTLLDVLAGAQPSPLAWPERIIVIRSTQPSQGGYASAPSVQYAMLGVNHGPKGPLPESEAPRSAADANAPGLPAPQPAEAERMTINLMAMVQHGDMSNNILLRPNDIVYVQPNPFGYVAREVEKIWSPFRAVGNSMSDFRQGVNDARWLGEGMPKESGTGRSTIIAR